MFFADLSGILYSIFKDTKKIQVRVNKKKEVWYTFNQIQRYQF